MKNLKLLIVIFVASLLNTSCLVDDTDETLEIAASRPYIVGFKTKSSNLSYFEDLGAIPMSYKVDLIGGFDGTPADSDLVLTYRINEAASSAVQGREFDFVGTVGTVTIPAGSDFATIDLLINTGNFDLLAPTVLVIDLISVQNDAAIVVAQNQTLTITFVGCQADLDEYSYMVTTIRVSTGGLSNSQVETIDMTATNSFRTKTVGPYGPGAAGGSIGGTEGYDLDVVCGVVTIPEQNLVALYSNLVFGSGTVDPVTGTMVNTYTITFGSGDRVYQSTYVRQ